MDSTRPDKEFSAVLAAGGRGTRVGSDALKQFRDLDGRPFLQWSLDALFTASCRNVVIVVPKDQQRTARDLFGDDRVEVVDGGPRRQDSVWNGLRLVDSDVVVIHDGARPLITPELVLRSLEALGDADGAVPVIAMDETLKQVKDDSVVKTVDRSKLVRVQTPQAFRTAILKDAHQKAQESKFEATDDAQLVERIGGRVVTFEGDRTNIKVTYEEDLLLVDALLAGRKSP